MSFFLIPISIFVKSITLTSYIPFINQYQIYAYLVLILAVLFKNKLQGEPALVDVRSVVNKKILTFTGIVLGLQLIAMVISHLNIGTNEINRDPIREFLKVIIIFICVFFHYILLRLVIIKKEDVYKFIQGSGIALLVLLIISYVQFLYLLFPKFFVYAVNFIGTFLEKTSDREWYSAGSYVETTHRINGLNSESGFLAAQLLIMFVPFILAAIKNKTDIFMNNRKYHASLYYILLAGIIVILFFAKSTTGILAILIILFSLWLNISKTKKLITSILLPICLGAIYTLTFVSPLVRDTLNITLLDKFGGVSFQNRFGSTIALMKTWLTHPVWGVGWNFNDYYVFKYVPQWTTSNYEYQNIFLPEHYYPILSNFFGWLAIFGTVAIAGIIYYVHLLLKDLRKISENNNDSTLNVLKDSAHYFIAFYFIISLFSFNWTDSMYFVMFYFFVVIRNRYKENWILEGSNK